MSINPLSTAKLGTHPLHPMLIPFPVAFLVGALVTDLAFVGTGDGFWARASMWLIGAGIVMALLAAVAGFTDFLGEARIRALNDAWYSYGGGHLVQFRGLSEDVTLSLALRSCSECRSGS